MYFIDRSKIEEILKYMEKLLAELNQQTFPSFKDKLGLERITHMFIESTLDVGNMMIDGFIMRDPGSYEDIIDILVDEEVLPEQDKNVYKKVIRLRKQLVRDYLAIDHEELAMIMLESKSVIERFSTHIRSYLNNELGVANAFTNK
ncbi:DUF86 domain-containing protein [Virgibacillus alimentarius]|uniref:Uncharacterized protein YutE (UPF0331/DUF86 family) n=1 Tax=Virgibacillus alimentarius TaxID=698769 RepID=A0ABS4S7C3_9BACI|nr:DUF86 domain-containing protein [Virgibacillus alimentarius]MBP2257319.1 uncharacterized protein YutE (UPF0331/DUF86 family) [Virgibacillus alimentarius]